MIISLERRAELNRLSFEGELTFRASDAAKSVLLQVLNDELPLQLDLAGVTMIDNTGVHLLVAAKRWARQMGRTLQMVGRDCAEFDLIELYEHIGELDDPVVLLAATDAPRGTLQ